MSEDTREGILAATGFIAGILATLATAAVLARNGLFPGC